LTPFVAAQEATTTKSQDQAAVATSSTEIRNAQRDLKTHGFNTGPVDGIMGPKTKGAIERFQAKKGLPQTGELDSETMKQLSAKAEPKSVTKSAENLGGDTKQAGKDVSKGHPVEAGKTFGSGAANMGKSVGHKTESGVDKGLDVVGKKIYGTTGDESDQTNKQGGAVAQPQQPQSTPK
jgi:peptidoglycan hydrolase-like protein with peptidoglycan-binding domain